MEDVKYERNGSVIDWSVKKSYLKDKSPEDVMMEKGYHPAGYGPAFQVREENGLIKFKSYASAD